MHQVISADTDSLRIPKQCKYPPSPKTQYYYNVAAHQLQRDYSLQYMHASMSKLYIVLSFQLTELSLSLRSPPVLEHQRANADQNRLCVNRRTQEQRGHINNKSASLLWSSPVVAFVNLSIEFLHSSLSCGPSPRFSRIQESAQSFYKVSHLTGLLKYLPAVGDQTLALNIVLNMHYTEGLMVTADVVSIPINDELKAIHLKMCHLSCRVYTDEW